MAMMVVAMSVMHEQVHQRAGQKNQNGEERCDVYPMLADDEISGDQYQADYHPVHQGVGAMTLGAVIVFHGENPND